MKKQTSDSCVFNRVVFLSSFIEELTNTSHSTSLHPLSKNDALHNRNSKDFQTKDDKNTNNRLTRIEYDVKFTYNSINLMIKQSKISKHQAICIQWDWNQWVLTQSEKISGQYCVKALWTHQLILLRSLRHHDCFSQYPLFSSSKNVNKMTIKLPLD